MHVSAKSLRAEDALGVENKRFCHVCHMPDVFLPFRLSRSFFSLSIFFFFGKCENVLFIVIDATNCSFTNAHATLTNIKYMYAWMIIIDVVCRCGSPISICRLLIFVIIFFSISLLFIFLIVKIVLNGCGHTMHEHQVHKWKCAARRTRHISREKWWCRAENMITVNVRNDNTWKCLRSSSSPLFAYIIYRMSTTTLFSLVGVGFTDIFCLSLSLLSFSLSVVVCERRFCLYYWPVLTTVFLLLLFFDCGDSFGLIDKATSGDACAWPYSLPNSSANHTNQWPTDGVNEFFQAAAKLKRIRPLQFPCRQRAVYGDWTSWYVSEWSVSRIAVTNADFQRNSKTEQKT